MYPRMHLIFIYCCVIILTIRVTGTDMNKNSCKAAESIEDAVPAELKKLLRGELAALDHEPEAVIDARERRVSGIVIGETPFGKADAHGLLGAFAEVEQRVVDIHQNCLEHEK